MRGATAGHRPRLAGQADHAGGGQHRSPMAAAELMAPGPLGEQSLGKDDAPVTIIEYASMTCPHCAHFHETVYPELKKRYIDTGKVRFIFREFPLDPLAAAGFMLARCGGKDKYFPMIETLFAQQKDWVVQKPLEPLLAIAKQAGFTQQTLRRLPGESEDARRHRGGAHPGGAEVRGQVDADVLRQRQDAARRPDDGGADQADRALSQELTRVFRRRRSRGSPRATARRPIRAAASGYRLGFE